MLRGRRIDNRVCGCCCCSDSCHAIKSSVWIVTVVVAFHSLLNLPEEKKKSQLSVWRENRESDGEWACRVHTHTNNNGEPKKQETLLRAIA